MQIQVPSAHYHQRQPVVITAFVVCVLSVDLTLTFVIIHLRGGDNWIIRTIRLTVLAFALRVRVQHQAWGTRNKPESLT